MQGSGSKKPHHLPPLPKRGGGALVESQTIFLPLHLLIIDEQAYSSQLTARSLH